MKSTLDYGLFFPRSAPIVLNGYTDSDHAACKETRRSIGAYVFQFAGGTVTWSSKRQSTVSQSTTEAEYRALSEGTREAVFLRRLLLELHFIPELRVALNCHDQAVLSSLSTAPHPTQQDIHLNLHCDNQGSINLAKNPVFIHALNTLNCSITSFGSDSWKVKSNSIIFPQRISRLTFLPSPFLAGNSNNIVPF